MVMWENRKKVGARLRGQPLFIVARKARSDLGRSFPKPELVLK
jgi:hypothetical protein